MRQTDNAISFTNTTGHPNGAKSKSDGRVKKESMSSRLASTFQRGLSIASHDALSSVKRQLARSHAIRRHSWGVGAQTASFSQRMRYKRPSEHGRPVFDAKTRWCREQGLGEPALAPLSVNDHHFSI